MATVTALIDLVVADLGLDGDASGDDRPKVLSALNEAYREITQRSLRLHTYVDHTPSAGVTDVNLSSVTTLQDHFLALDRIRVIQSGVISKPITRLTQEDLLDQRVTEQGAPGAYAYAWPNVMLNCPADGVMQLRLHYIKSPLLLIETGTDPDVDEDTPSAIPAGWHERLLGSCARALLLEGYEGQEALATAHRNRFEQALQNWREMQIREGGLQMSHDEHAVRLFDTPSSARVR